MREEYSMDEIGCGVGVPGSIFLSYHKFFVWRAFPGGGFIWTRIHIHSVFGENEGNRRWRILEQHWVTFTNIWVQGTAKVFGIKHLTDPQSNGDEVVVGPF